MNLSGVIDAAVMGGVKKYREAFFDGTYIQEYPDHAKFIPKFKEAMHQQIDILKEGLDIFSRYCQESLLPLNDHLTTTYRKMKNELNWMDNVDQNNKHRISRQNSIINTKIITPLKTTRVSITRKSKHFIPVNQIK